MNCLFRPLNFEEIIPKGNKAYLSRYGARKFKGIPRARSGHRIVADASGNIYSFGGFNPHLLDDLDIDVDEIEEIEQVWSAEQPLFKELWRFSHSSQRWTKLITKGEMPSELASHAMLLINNFILVYGGTGYPFGSTSSNRIYICDLKKLEWHLMKIDEENSKKPLELYGQAIVFNQEENALYTIGGTTGFWYTIDVHKFDFTTNRWIDVWTKSKSHDQCFPGERYRHEVALFQNRIFVFGGGNSERCFGFKRIDAFNIKTQRWEKISTRESIGEKKFPRRRRCHGCVHIEDDVYIVGGTYENIIYDDLWKFNLKTFQWTLVKNQIPNPIYFHSAAISPHGRMTIFGGIISALPPLRTNEVHSVWLKIPPLQEIVWQFICNRNRNNLLSVKSTDLLKIGIPHHFISRLR